MIDALSRFRLIIFDADGTLRWTVKPGQKYPLAPQEWRLMPHVRDALSSLTANTDGPRLAIASNQHGVAMGLLSEALARRMLEDIFRAAVGHVPEGSLIEMCIHDEDSRCACRKPSPGMLFRLMARCSIAPSETLFVGDQPIDAEAAARAGVSFMWAADFFATDTAF